MSVDRFYRTHRGFVTLEETSGQSQFKEITKCFVRKDHTCGKFLGASKSCFIACPSTEEVETTLALITEKLTKIGIEPVIAIKERAYGQDIFCTKICGKIIESQFCLVMLDDDVKESDGTKISTPNSNVYYEYGLMTALGKHVVPLQKEGHKLAFNIQTHDTVKYTPRNISAELDRAFKDATKITEEDRKKSETPDSMPERVFIRSFELASYKRKDYNWFLSDDVVDTAFTAFGHPKKQEYLFVTIAQDKKSLENALTDMQVIMKRLETRHDEMKKEVEDLSSQAETLKKEVDQQETTPVLFQFDTSPRVRYFDSRSLDEMADKINDFTSKLELMQNSKFVIILGSEIVELRQKVAEQDKNIERQKLPFPLYLGDPTGVQIGETKIIFKHPAL